MAKRAAGDATAHEQRNTTTRKKRLANAKVKPVEKTDTKKSKSATKQQTRERHDEEKHVARNVVISVFAVLMALSMMLPSFATIFSNNQQNQTAEAEAQAAAEASEDEEDASEEEKTGMDLVDDNYSTTITPLEEKLKENAKDLATLLNLGNDYMSWASTASSYIYSSDDYQQAQEHVNDLYEQAIDYYDQYLKLNDSNAVKVNRALCQYYSGAEDEAQEALEQLTKDAADYGPAWANLGLIYESKADLTSKSGEYWDKATETYKKASEVDSDDEYGAKTFANQRLTYMNMDEIQRTTDTLTPAESASGLSDQLNSGLSYERS